MYCPSCGEANEENARFCHSCGAALPSGSDQPSEVEGPSPEPAPPPPPSSGGGPEKVNILGELGNWISKGFSEVFANLGMYVLLGLIVIVVSTVTIGILTGPLLAGTFKVVRRKLRGEGEIDIGDVFSEGIAVFLPSFMVVVIICLPAFILSLTLNSVLVIGPILGILVMVTAGTLGILGLHFVKEEGKDFMPAIQSSWEVFKNDIVGFMLFGIVAGVVCCIGVLLCFVGIIFTAPVGIVMAALLLESLFPKRA